MNTNENRAKRFGAVLALLAGALLAGCVDGWGHIEIEIPDIHANDRVERLPTREGGSK